MPIPSLKRQDSPRDDERFYMYNTPHVVTIGLNYLLESLEFGAKLAIQERCAIFTLIRPRTVYQSLYQK